MNIITIYKYRATDGTVFDTKAECVEYEQTLNKDLLVFNKDGEIIKVQDWINEKFVILWAKTDGAAQFFYDTYNDGYITPWDEKDFSVEKGIYVFYDSNWFTEENIKKVTDLIKTIKENY